MKEEVPITSAEARASAVLVSPTAAISFLHKSFSPKRFTKKFSEAMMVVLVVVVVVVVVLCLLTLFPIV